MAQKERLKEIKQALKYFIEINYPIQNTLLLFEGDDNISDEKQRIYQNLMSDESLIIDDLDFTTKEVKSQVCLNSPTKNKRFNLSIDFGKLENTSKQIGKFFLIKRN
jgi:hypothetical protein